MIPRYSRPEMVAIWSPETRFRIWFEIEAHACDALAELGVIPKEAARTIWEKGGAATFDVERIDEIERETKHDVIAFLTHLAEFVGPDARFIHQGMTSSDVLDTCFSVQLVRASRHPACRPRRAACGAEEARLRAQGHGHDRPQPRHPCRADDLRRQAGAGLCRVFALPRAAGRGARGDRDLRDLGRGRHLRQHRSARRGACRGQARAEAGAGLDAGHPARPPCDVLRHARRHRLVDRAAGDRNPPSAAHRSAGGGRVFLAGPEGLVGDAAQAQPGADREPDRPCPHGALLRDAGDGERGALARARHLAFLGRAHDRPGRDDHARFRAGAADRRRSRSCWSIPTTC